MFIQDLACILEYMPYIYAGNGLITLKSETVIIKSIISLFLSFEYTQLEEVYYM